MAEQMEPVSRRVALKITASRCDALVA